MGLSGLLIDIHDMTVIDAFRQAFKGTFDFAELKIFMQER